MNFKKMALVSAMGMVMFAGAANAADQGHGQVFFDGSIIDAPCSLNSDSEKIDVHFDEVSNVLLQNGGTNDGQTDPEDIIINLENCSVKTGATVETTFTGAQGGQGKSSLGITGTAKGASIILTDGKSAPITLGEATDGQAIQNGHNTLKFAAYLKGDGASSTIIPGTFSAVADFTLAYP
ncbi:fimbrial protein [Citrobacter farmeri]|uniref:Fimbria A protein n=1 Tax=Citrobacter amalonaticus Y19 TaxID=1261127 RepID=M1K6G9_CITAM|nr:fimbrial protein [Citrobacter amalonaticus]AGE94443.1 fimbria A protein [Citrobacter amalonaticus Y19]EKV5654382.1 type 1 fimbrial protein [Citrobacter farmeri]